MPISYSINHEGGYVRATWSGDVDGTEFAAHLERLLADSEAMKYGRSLADVRGANLTLAGWELGAGVRQKLARRIEAGVWTTAILVSSDLQFGVARQFGAYGDGLVRSAIFLDESAAESWLREQV